MTLWANLLIATCEHLRLLHIGFYSMAAMSGFLSLFSLVYMALGGIFVAGALSSMGDAAKQIPPQLGWIFVGIGACFLFFGLTITVLLFLAGEKVWSGATTEPSAW